MLKRTYPEAEENDLQTKIKGKDIYTEMSFRV